MEVRLLSSAWLIGWEGPGPQVHRLADSSRPGPQLRCRQDATEAGLMSALPATLACQTA
jgi:hypothetical protein